MNDSYIYGRCVVYLWPICGISIVWYCDCRFACSKSGHIFEIDHKKMSIANIHRLLPRTRDGEKQTMHSGKQTEILYLLGISFGFA